MPSVHFTAQWLKSLQPPAEGQIDYFDSAGLGEGRSFGLRVSYGGKMSWFVLYRRNGKLRRLTLDTPYPRLGLKDAREAADAEKGPGRPQRDLMADFEDRLSGLGAAIGKGISVTGTFSSAAVSGLGTGGDAAERTATATEATAKNTKRLLDASVDNGLRFA